MSLGVSSSAGAASRTTKIREQYQRVRAVSDGICRPLEAEDQVIQSMPDASPTRWHLAHTTWFFETFVLANRTTDYVRWNHDFETLFNSYYNAVGNPFPRAKRGLLSRPTVAAVHSYRQAIDERMLVAMEQLPDDDEVLDVIELGLHHEQQHQELMLTDIKHAFSCNPLHPVYQAAEVASGVAVPDVPVHWVPGASDVVSIGYGEGLANAHDMAFTYDNEQPRHQVFLHPHSMASRLVTNGDYLKFIDDGGYAKPEFWLSMGWSTVQQEAWEAPLYWLRDASGFQQFTLSGLRDLDPHEPVCHVSYFEADAYARWAGHRLPTEFEWEHRAAQQAATDIAAGNFVEQKSFHPRPLSVASSGSAHQMFGDVWEWTSSPYIAYPGYRPPPGALGEYNGKFMCNQFVLRGGSCATSRSHIRPTYRNFFPPEARWQFSGIRLAKDK